MTHRLLAGAILAILIAPTAAAATHAGPKVIAHRGDMAAGPEDTVPALRAASAAGFDYVELDVWLTSDTVAVVMHDATLDRMTDRTGAIETMTFAQVREATVDVGTNAALLRPKVPTLWEALDAIRAAGSVTRVLVEVKSQPATSAQQRAIVSKVIDLGMWSRVTFMSFSSTALRRVRDYARTAYSWRPRTGLYFNKATDLSVLRAFDVASMAYPLATPASIATWHAAGLTVYPFTVDSVATWDELAAAGVDGMLTDEPWVFAP